MGYEFVVPSAKNSATARRNENLGQLYFNHHFDQLSRRTPPAIVSRERREKPGSALVARNRSGHYLTIPSVDPAPCLCASPYPDPVRVRISFRSSRFTSHESQVTPIQQFARSFSLLRLFFRPRSFVFNNFQPLFQKHPGWHTPPRPSQVTGLQSQVTPFAFSNKSSRVTGHESPVTPFCNSL